MSIDPYCQRPNCSPSNVFFNGVDYVDIAGRSSASGVKQEWGGVGKQAIFELNAAISQKRIGYTSIVPIND